MPRRQSGGFLHKELAKLDNNYFAKERFAALASRRRLGNHRAAGIMAAAIGAQFQDAGSAAAMQLALAAVLIRNATVNFIVSYDSARATLTMSLSTSVACAWEAMPSWCAFMLLWISTMDGRAVAMTLCAVLSALELPSLIAFTAWLYRMSQSGPLNGQQGG